MKSKISILVVNYNTEKHIKCLLNDLLQQNLEQLDFEVIITNNIQNNKLCDEINSIKLFKKLNIHIIQSNQNIGFGRAMNLAAQHAAGEHLLIINPDIQITNKDYIQQLFIKSQQHINYGIISTTILSDKKGYKTKYQHYEFSNTLGYDNQVCWISGALMLIRAEVFKRINGFDPDFFMYCEDEDISYRIKQLNLDLIIIEDLEVFHLGGASEPNHDHAFYLRWYRSKLLFASKHFSEPEFKQLVSDLEHRSRFKLRKYKIFRCFYLKSYQKKIVKWQVMLDLSLKIQKEGSDWLAFSI